MVLLPVVLSIPFLLLIAFRPVVRRLALRNSVRRPRETALVVLGSLLGTAIITGSFVVGDTLGSSLRRSAYTQLGPVDVVATTSGTDAESLARSVENLPSSEVDGILPVVTVTASVSTVGSEPLAEPRATLLEVDFKRAAAFGDDPGATGISGATPGEGETVLGEDLAESLDVREGDQVRAHAYSKSLELKVVRVLPRLGVAGLRLGFGGSESPNAFVAPGTIARLASPAFGLPPIGAPPLAAVLVSAQGGVIPAPEREDVVRGLVAERFGDRAVQVYPAKWRLLEQADESGSQFTELFGGIGFFSVIAGILLLVNIFVMLAQERKTELGMLRAVGLRRSGLVASFSLEGWMYSLVSSLLGAILGLGVGRVIVAVATGLFAEGGPDFSVEMIYTPTLSSILNGFALGFLISLATVVITSISISRLNVIRAIRDLPDPEPQSPGIGRLMLAAVVLIVGAAITLQGISALEPAPSLIGPALAATGVVPLLSHWVPRRPLVSVAAALVLAWQVLAFELVRGAFRDPEIPIFVVNGVLLTASAVALVSQNQTTIGGVVRRAGGGARSITLRLGLAYPLARKFRTGMILTMYALVVFTLVLITVFSHSFKAQIDTFTRRIAGGFDLTMSSNISNPVATADVRSMPGVESVAAISVVWGAEWKTDATKGSFESWPAASYDEEFVARGPVAIETRDAKFATDEDVYRAVLADANLVIIPGFFLADNGGGPPPTPPQPGERVRLRDPLSGAERELTVVAVAESGFGHLLPFVQAGALREVFGDRVVQNELRIATRDGTDNEGLAREINARFLENGADSRSYRELVNENLNQQNGFFRLLQGYLAIGLIIGIAGLGVVMVRAVRERRRQIGVLRSLGFEPNAVRRAFVAESAFVALEGIVVGTVLAMITSWRFLSNDTFGGSLGFTVPWVQVTLLVAGTFIASMIATAAPAQQASRIRPAVALRLTD